MNSVEFCKKPTYSEKSARLKFGVFQQNRPRAVISDIEICTNSMTAILRKADIQKPELWRKKKLLGGTGRPSTPLDSRPSHLRSRPLPIPPMYHLFIRNHLVNLHAIVVVQMAVAPLCLQHYQSFMPLCCNKLSSSAVKI
jgi:hypothetical protein